MISSKSSDSNQPASKQLVYWWSFSTDANRKETSSILKYIEKICTSENRKLLIAPSLLKWSLRDWLLARLERLRGPGIKPNTWNHRGWFEEKQNQKKTRFSDTVCYKNIAKITSHRKSLDRIQISKDYLAEDEQNQWVNVLKTKQPHELYCLQPLGVIIGLKDLVLYLQL